MPSIFHGVVHRDEFVDVQELVAQAPVKRLDQLEHDQHAQIAESRTAHGDVADALPQGDLIDRLALGIPPMDAASPAGMSGAR
jgi:hypothetical protein